MEWMKCEKELKDHAKELARAADLKMARAEFKGLSDAMIAVITCFGTSGETPVYKMRCPMFFENKGADWLQDKKEVENPYYGKVMLKCGSLAETISPGKDGEKHDHEGSGMKGSDMKGEEHRHE